MTQCRAHAFLMDKAGQKEAEDCGTFFTSFCQTRTKTFLRYIWKRTIQQARMYDIV